MVEIPLGWRRYYRPSVQRTGQVNIPPKAYRSHFFVQDGERHDGQRRALCGAKVASLARQLPNMHKRECLNCRAALGTRPALEVAARLLS